MSEFPEEYIKDWSHFLEIANLLDTAKVGGMTYAFRGQSVSTWRLLSSLNRFFISKAITAEEALNLEFIGLEEFKSQAHHHLSTNELLTTKGALSWWTVMQHHGAPTRLLDWTDSIFVAAYFAAIARPDEDGAIFAVHMNTVNGKLLSHYGTDELYIPGTKNIKDGMLLERNAPSLVFFLRKWAKSERIIAQQGHFSVCFNILGDQQEIIGECCSAGDKSFLHHRKYIVPKDLKRTLVRKLRQMNITANSLFPGLDGLARSVAELVELGITELPSESS